MRNPNEGRYVLSLFDYTGEAVKPWARAGYTCICLDTQHPSAPTGWAYGKGRIIKGRHTIPITSPALSVVDWTIDNASATGITAAPEIDFVFGWPPCTDLSGCGARWWASKRLADPEFQTRAVQLVKTVERIAQFYRCPYLIENPKGALSIMWRAPDHRFSPHEYGGYCPPGPHPTWPEIIPERDAYTKSTCLWTSPDFVMPKRDPVEPVIVEYRRKDGRIVRGSPMWAKLGGKSLKTKNIRSATPRGFAEAVFGANAPHMKQQKEHAA